MKKSPRNYKGGLEWTGGSRLCDLDYADDTAIIETSQTGMQQLTREIERISGSVGLRMNANKCKIMVSNTWEDKTAVITEGTEVELVEDFCYLGSNISRLGNCDKKSIKCVWKTTEYLEK